MPNSWLRSETNEEIVIALPADLNTEDDEGYHTARQPEGVFFAPAQVVVAGCPGGWSFASVHDTVTTPGGTFMRFTAISSSEAAARAQ